MKLIRQRNRADCSRACLAMVMGVDYEYIDSLFPRAADAPRIGCEDEMHATAAEEISTMLAMHGVISSYLISYRMIGRFVPDRANEFRQRLVFTEAALRDYLRGRRAIISTDSHTSAEYIHSVVLDRHLVMDPMDGGSSRLDDVAIYDAHVIHHVDIQHVGVHSR